MSSTMTSNASNTSNTSNASNASNLMELFDRFKNDEGTYDFGLEEFESILRGNTKLKRPQSAYFMWLNATRKEIETKYFSDYKEIEKDQWDDEEFKSKYYSEKGLNPPKPVIPKEGKTPNNKPKLVALVTSKAGIMWKELDEDTKSVYESKYKESKQIYENSKDYFKN
jgi:hypothetical protein